VVIVVEDPTTSVTLITVESIDEVLCAVIVPMYCPAVNPVGFTLTVNACPVTPVVLVWSQFPWLVYGVMFKFIATVLLLTSTWADEGDANEEPVTAVNCSDDGLAVSTELPLTFRTILIVLDTFGLLEMKTIKVPV